MDVSLRRAARVLLVDQADRLLMFRGFDPASPDDRYWVTAGGGIDAGETMVEGAVRELAEETGLRLPPERMGDPVRHEVIEYPFDGVLYRQEQEFFLVRVPAFEISTDGWDELERQTIDRHRWWRVVELETTDEQIYPTDLAGFLRRLLAEAGAVADAPAEEGQC